MERRRRRIRPEAAPELPAPQPQPEAPQGEPPAPDAVRVQWGPIREPLQVQGMTVGAVLSLLRDPYNIAPDATTLVNGRRVSARHRLTAGDVLEFTRPAGEKG